MERTSADIALTELGSLVAEAAALLEAHGDKFVSARIRKAAAGLSTNPAAAVQTLLADATGSMGSLQDRVLSPMNGDDILPEDETAVNGRLFGIIQRIAEMARIAQRTLA